MHAPPKSHDDTGLSHGNHCYDTGQIIQDNFSTSGMSSLNNDTPSHISDFENDAEPIQILKNVKISNINRLVIGNLNINSLRNKFESLKIIVKGNIDILILTETKLDDTFPSQQFAIEGYKIPFRLDKNGASGGVMIYVRGDIPCRELIYHSPISNIEGIFIELNLRKTKWMLFGGYNYNKSNIGNFVW